ncbi:MAG: hypothetical protein JKY14_09515 [Paraglaciecola sp.]|nr:hypothetical protein [Paraglaciecola sp.]
MRLIIGLALLLSSLPMLAQFDQSLQRQLIKMAEQSHDIRQNLEKQDLQNVSQALQSMAAEINNIHTQTLKEIVSLHGWPSKEQVGEKGVRAAFNLVQNCKDLAFQRDMLPLVIQSYLNKDGIAGQDVAQFTDTVSIKLGKKQVFGTQVKWLNSKVVFAPIDNEDSVNQLRAQLGMSSLAQYKKTLEHFYSVKKNQ